ncbi:unnamed protein product [Bemisia tabaci]|uniref:C2H2-type domain-containing protein n=1 Tax=Bemisia tabaci TaxID=7038 RepID=A0A9P0EXQ9_BEMTA|nr:unnamed protein product [Bemisia tabaci]
MLNNFGEANRIHNGQEATSQSQPQLQPYPPHPSQPPPNVPGPLPHPALPALSSRSYSTPAHLDEYFNCMFQPKIFSGQRNTSSNFKRNPSNDYSFEKRSPYAVCYKSCCQPSPYSMNATATPSALQFSFGHPNQQSNPESIGLQDQMMPNQSHQQSQQMDFHYLPSPANTIFNQRVSNPNSHETPSGIGSHYTSSNYLHPSFYNPRPPNFLPEYYERTPSKNQSPKSTIKQQTSVIKNSNDFPYASEMNQKSLPPPNYIFSKRPESFLPSYLPPCSQPNFPPSNQYSTHRNPIIDAPIPAPPYRNFNYSVPAATPTTPVVEPKSQPEAPKKSSSKPLDVRQFLETWDDDDDEPGVASGESPTPVISSSNKSSQLSANLDQRNSISDLNASRGEYPVITPDPENSVLFKILKLGGGAERGPIDTPFANLEHYPYNRVQLGISNSPIEPPNNPNLAPLQSYPRTFERTPPNYAPSIFQHDSMMYGSNEKCNKPDYHDAKVVVPAEKMCNSPCPISSPSDLSQTRRVTSSPKKTYLNLEHNVIKNNDLYSQSNQLKNTGRSRPSTPSLDYDFRDPEQFIKPTIINKADYQRKDQSEDSILKHAPKSDSKKGKNVKERNVSVVPPNNAVQRNSNVQRSDKALKPPNPAPYTEAMTQFHRNQIPYNKTTLMPYCMPPGNPLPSTGYDYPVMSVINNSHNYVKYDNRPSYASEEPKYDNTCSVNINLNITSDKSPQVFLNSVSTPSPNHPPHSSPNDSSRLLPQSSPTKCITANSDLHKNLHKKEKQKSISQKSCSENNAPSNLTVVRSHGTFSTNFVPKSVPESIPEAFQIHSLISPHKSNDHADFINSSNNSAIRDLSKMAESVPIHQVDSSQKWNKVADLTSVRSPYVSSFNLPAHCPPKIDKSDSAANSSHPTETSNQSCLFQPLAIGKPDKRTDGNSTHFVGNEILKKSCTTEPADKSQAFVDDRPKTNANNSLTSEVFDTQYYKSCIYDSSSSKNNTNQAQVVDNSNEIAQCLVSRPNLDINSNSIGVKHKTTLSNDPSRISPQALETLSDAGVDFQKEAGENNSVKTAVLNDTSNSAICGNENTVITSTLRASLVQTLQESSGKQPGGTSNNIENLAVGEIFPVEENKSPPKSLSGRKNVSSSAEELFVDEETIDSIINERCDSFGAVEFPVESSSQTNDQGDASDRIPPLSLLPFPESGQAAPICVNSNVSPPDGTAVDPSSDAMSKKAKVVSGMADLLNSDSDSNELEDKTVKTRRNKKRRPASNDYSSFDLFSDNGTFFSDARHKPGSSKNDKISEGNDCYGLTGTVSQSLQGTEARKTDELTLSKSDNHTDFEMLVQNEMNKFNFESDILNNIGSLDVEVEPPQFFSEHSSTSEPKSIGQSMNDNANKTSNVNSDLNVSTAITSIRAKMDDLLQEKILETERLEELDGTKRNSSLFCEEMPPSKLKKEETDLKDKDKKKKKSKKEKKEKKKLDSKKRKPAQVTDPDQNSTLPIKKLSLEETHLVKADHTTKELKTDKLLSQVNEPHNTQENKWERVDSESSHEKSNPYKSFKPVIRNIDSLLENDIFEPEPPVTTQAPVIISDYMKRETHPEVESHLQAKSNESFNFTIERSSDDHKNCESESTLHQKHSKKKKKKKKKEKREKEDFLKQSFGPTVEKKIDLSNPASRNEPSKIKTATRSKAQDYDDSKFETPKLSTSTAPSIVSADSVRNKSCNLSLDWKLIVSAADYIENQSSQSASNLETPETGSTRSQLSNSQPIVHEKKVEISVSPPSDDDSNSSFDCKIDRKLLESIKFPVSKFEHRKSRNSLSQSSVDSVISSASNLFHESYADQPESRVIISSKVSSKICSRRYRSNLSESSTTSSVISTSCQDKVTIEDDCQNSRKLRASRYSSNDDEFIGLSPTISNNLSQDEENQDEGLEANNKFLSENDPFFFRKDTASSTPRQILSPIKTKSDVDTFSDAESLNDERRIEPINFNNSLNPGPTPFFDQISRRNNTSPVLGDTVYEPTETSISCNQDLQDSLSEENLDQEVEDCLKEVTSIRSKIHNPPGNLSDLKPNQRIASIADDAGVFEINSGNTSKSVSNQETSENNEGIEALPENSPTQKLTRIEQYLSPASEEIICLDSPSINSLAQNSLPCPKSPFSPPHFDDIISVNSQQAPSPSNIEAVAPRKSDAECSPTAINLIEQLPACSEVTCVKSISMTVNSDVSSNKASLITNPLPSKTEESWPKVSHTQSSTDTSFIIDSQMHCSENRIQEVNEALSLKNSVLNESALDLTQQKANSSGSSFSLVPEHNFCDQSPSNTDFNEGEISPHPVEMVISTARPDVNCPPQKKETQSKDSTAESIPESTASTETCVPPRSPQNMEVYPEKSYAEVDPLPSLQNMIVHSEELNADYVCATSQSSQNGDPLLIESNTEYNSTTGRISQKEEPNSMTLHVDSNISTETSAQSQPNPEESGYELLTAGTNSIKSPTDNFALHEETILTKESSTQILREVTTMPSLQSNELQLKATESSSNHIDSNDCSTAHLSLESCSLDDKESHEELSQGDICPINNPLSSPTLKNEESLKERTVEVLAEDSSLTDISIGFQFSEPRPVTNQLSEDPTGIDEQPCKPLQESSVESCSPLNEQTAEHPCGNAHTLNANQSHEVSSHSSPSPSIHSESRQISTCSADNQPTSEKTVSVLSVFEWFDTISRKPRPKTSSPSLSKSDLSRNNKEKYLSKKNDSSTLSSLHSSSGSDSNPVGKKKGAHQALEPCMSSQNLGNNPPLNDVKTPIASSEENENSKIKIDPIPFESKSSNLTLSPEDGDTVRQELTASKEASEIEISSRNEHIPMVDESTPIATETQALFSETFFGDKEASCKIINQTVKFQKADSHTVLFDGTKREQEKDKNKLVMSSEKTDRKQSSKTDTLDSSAEVGKKLLKENLNESEEIIKHDKSSKDFSMTNTQPKENFPTHTQHNQKVTIEEPSRNVRNSYSDYLEFIEKRDVLDETKESCEELITESSVKPKTCAPKKEKSTSRRKGEETKRSKHRSNEEDEARKKKKGSKDNDVPRPKMKSSEGEYLDAKRESLPPLQILEDKKHEVVSRIENSSRNEPGEETEKHSRKKDKSFSDLKSGSFTEIKCKENKGNSDISSKEKIKPSDSKSHQKYDTEKSRHRKKYSDTPSKSTKDCSSSLSERRIVEDETKSSGRSKIGTTSNSKLENSHRSKSHDRKSRKDHTDQSPSRSKRPKDETKHCDKRKNMTDHQVDRGKSSSSDKQSKVASGKNEDKIKSTSKSATEDNIKICNSNFKSGSNVITLKEDNVGSHEVNTESVSSIMGHAAADTRNEALKNGGIERGGKAKNKIILHPKPADSNPEKKAHVSSSSDHSSPAALDKNLSKKGKESQEKLSKPKVDLNSGREKPLNCEKAPEIPSKMKSHDTEVPRIRDENFPKIEVKRSEGESRHKIEAYCPVRNWECPFVSKDNARQMKIRATTHADSWSYMESSRIDAKSMNIESLPSNEISSQNPIVPNVSNCSENYSNGYSSREKIAKSNILGNTLDQTLVNPLKRWKKPQTSLDSYRGQTSKILTNSSCSSSKHSEKPLEITSNFELELDQISAGVDSVPKTPESEFVGTPETPDSSFGRIPKTPESNFSGTSKTPELDFNETPKTPEIIFEKAPPSPESSFGKIPKTPEIIFEKAPKTPESIFERAATPENSLERTSKTSESNFSETPRTPESILEDIAITPGIGSDEVCKTPGRSFESSSEILEDSFTKTPKTPDSSFGRAPETPKISFEGTSKTPESNFDRAPETPGRSFSRTSKSPERRYDFGSSTTEKSCSKSLEAPASSSAQTPTTLESSFGRAVESERNYAETPKTPECCFGRSTDVDRKVSDSGKKFTDSQAAEADLHRTEKWKCRQSEVKKETEQNSSRNEKVMRNNDTTKKKKHKEGRYESEKHDEKSGHRSRKDSARKVNKDDEADAKKLKSKSQRSNQLENQSSSLKSSSSRSKSKSRSSDLQKVHAKRSKTIEVDTDSPSRKNLSSQIASDEEVPKVKNSVSSKIKPSTSDSTAVNEPVSFSSDFELDFDKHEIDFDNFHKLFDQTWEKFSKLKESSKKNKANPKSDVRSKTKETEIEKPPQSHSAAKTSSLGDKDRSSHKSSSSTDKENAKSKINLPKRKQDDMAGKPSQQLNSMNNMKEVNSEVDDNLKLLTNVFGTNKTKYKQSGSQYQTNRYEAPPKPITKMNPTLKDHPIYHAENYKILDISKIPLPPDDGNSFENVSPKNSCTDDPNVINIKLLAMVGNQLPERFDKDSIHTEKKRNVKESVIPSLNSQEMLIPRQVSSLNSVDTKFLGPVIPKAIVPVGENQPCPSSQNEREQFPSVTSSPVSKARDKEALYSSLYKKMKHKRLLEKNRLSLEKELSIAAQDRPNVPNLNPLQSDTKISKSSDLHPREVPDSLELKPQDQENEAEAFTSPGMIPLPAEPRELSNDEDSGSTSDAGREKNEYSSKEDEIVLSMESTLVCEPPTSEFQVNVSQTDENKPHYAPLQSETGRCENIISITCKALSDQKDVNESSETVLPLSKLDSSEQQQNLVFKAHEEEEEEKSDVCSSESRKRPSIDSSKLIATHTTEGPTETALNESDHLDSFKNPISNHPVEPVFECEQVSSMPEEIKSSKECLMNEEAQLEFVKSKLLKWKDTSAKKSVSAGSLSSIKKILQKDRKKHKKSSKRKKNKVQLRSPHSDPDKSPKIFKAHPDETSYLPRFVPQNVSSVSKSVKSIEEKPNTSTLDMVKNSSSVTEPYELEEGELKELDTEMILSTCPTLSRDSSDKILSLQIKASSPQLKISEEISIDQPKIDPEISTVSSELESNSLPTASLSNFIDKNEEYDLSSDQGKNSLELKGKASVCETSIESSGVTDFTCADEQGSGRNRQDSVTVEIENFQKMQQILENVCSEEDDQTRLETQKSTPAYAKVNAISSNATDLICEDTETPGQSRNPPSSKLKPPDEFPVQSFSNDGESESNVDDLVLSQNHSLTLNLESTDNDSCILNGTKIVSPVLMHSIVSEPPLGTAEEPNVLMTAEQKGTTVSIHGNETMTDDCESVVNEHATLQAEIASESDRVQILSDSFCDKQTDFNWDFDEFDTCPGESASEVPTADLATEENTLHLSEKCISCEPPTRLYLAESEIQTSRISDSPQKVNEPRSVCTQDEFSTKTSDELLSGKSTMASNAESIQETEPCQNYTYEDNLAEISPKVASQTDEPSNQMLTETDNSADSNLEMATFSNEILQSSELSNIEDLASTDSPATVDFIQESSSTSQLCENERGIVEDFYDSEVNNLKETKCIRKILKSCPKEDNNTENLDQSPNRSIQKNASFLETGFPNDILTEKNHPQAHDINQETQSDSKACEDDHVRTLSSEHRNNSLPVTEPTEEIEPVSQILTSNSHCAELEVKMGALDLTQKMVSSSEENSSCSPKESLVESESKIINIKHTENFSQITVDGLEKLVSPTLPENDVETSSHLSENLSGRNDVNFDVGSGMASNVMSDVLERAEMTSKSSSRSPTVDCQVEDGNVCDSTKTSGLILSDAVLHDPLNLNVEMEVVIGSSGDENEEREPIKSHDSENEVSPIKTFHAEGEDSKTAHKIPSPSRKRRKRLTNSSRRKDSKKKRFTSPKNVAQKEQCASAGIFLSPELTSEKIQTTINSEDKIEVVEDEGGRKKNFDNERLMNTGNEISENIEMTERKIPPNISSAETIEEVFLNDEHKDSVHLKESASVTGNGSYEKMDEGEHFLEPTEGDNSLCTNRRLSKKCKSVELLTRNVFSPETGSNKSSRSMSYLRLKSTDSDCSFSPNYLKGLEHDSSNSFMKCFSFIKDSMPFITDSTACLTDSEVGSPSLAKEIGTDINEGVCLPPAGSDMDESITAALCDSQLRCFDECPINNTFSYEGKGNLANPEMELIGSEEAEDNENMETQTCNSKSESDLKVRLPWNRIFNLKKRRRKNITSSKGIELGPAKIEIRLNSSENSGSWKVIQNSSVSVSSGSNCSLGSPIGIKVNRLVLQRHPTNDADSSKIGEVEIPKIKDSIPETIPKVIIKKNGTKRYKSFFKISSKQLPVVKILRNRHIDLMALKLKEMVDISPPSVRAEQSPLQPTAIRQWTGPKSRRPGFKTATSSEAASKLSAADTTDSNRKATNVKVKKLPKLLREMQLDDPPEVDYSRPICLSTRRKVGEKNKVLEMSKTPARETISLATIREESDVELNDADNTSDNFPDNVTLKYFPSSMGEPCDKDGAPKRDLLHQSSKRRKVEINVPNDSSEKDSNVKSSLISFESIESQNFENDVVEGIAKTEPAKKKGRSISFDSDRKGVYQRSRSSCQICCAAVEETNENSNMTNNLFHCTKCCLEFKSQEEEKAHDIAFHKNTAELQSCCLCHVSFVSEFSFKQHLKSRLHQLLESVQKETINSLFKHFTGNVCPQLEHSPTLEVQDRENHLTPLQIVLESEAACGKVDKY